MSIETSRPKWMDPALAVALAAIIIAWRLSAHTPNVAPTAAAAMFAGFAMRSRALALLGPLLGMLVSDLWIGFYEPPVVATVYASLLAPVALRGFLRSGASGSGASPRAWALRIGLGSVGASILFFVATNLAIWAWSGWYARTGDALATCFISALPFLKFTLAGDALFSAAFFGTWALATRGAPSRFTAAQRAA